MRCFVLLLMGAGLVLALAGPAPAGLILPEDGGEGFWGDPNALEGASWGFKIDYGPGYSNYLTLIQARVIPLGTPPDQYLEDTHLDPSGHYPLVKGGGNPTPVGWTNVANYGDVWLLEGGNALRGGFQYFTAWFGLGTVSHYVVSGSPDFVLQMQAYGYSSSDPSTIFRLHNQEFWFHDGGWENYSYNGMAHASESGLSGAGLTAWGATSPAPEPASMAVWGLLGGLGIAGAWWRRRRKAA